MNRRSKLLAAILVALTAAAVYAHTLGHDFVFDDGPEVVDNDLIRSLANVPRMFTTGAWEGSGEKNPIYRPLTTATYALNFAAGGLSPAGYHAANVLLHALAAALVLALALRLGMPFAGAVLAGLLFAVHPVQVEVVANVAGRKDALATAFAIAAVLAHAAARERGGAALAAAPLAMAAAMFSKETGVTAVGLVAAYDLLFRRSSWRAERRRAAALYAIYAVEAGVYLLARRAAVGGVGVPLDAIPWNENPIAHAPGLVRILTAVGVVARGAALLVAPLRLSPDYSYAAIREVTSPWDPWFLAGAALIAAAVAVGIATRRRSPLGAFAVLWYACTLFPGSNLLFPVGTIFGERLLYLPSVGFCLAAGGVVAALATTRAASGARWASAALVVLLAARTVAYAGVWADELSLFSEGVRVQPLSSKMRQSLGGALMERGRVAEAAEEFRRELAILSGTPTSTSRARLELGVAYEQLGALDEAARVYGEILRQDPRYSDALWRLGVVRWAQGRRADAVETWRETVSVDPGHARALSDLGIAYSLQGDPAAAKEFWLRATRADPRLASAWLRLGNLYEREGDLDQARAAWREFLRHAHQKYPREQAEVESKLGGGGLAR